MRLFRNLFYFIFCYVQAPFLLVAVWILHKRGKGLIWGPDAILNNKYWSDAMQTAGFLSQTLMRQVSRISKKEDFDLYFENVPPLFIKGCVYRFLSPKPGIVKKITGVEEVKTWRNILDCETLVHKGEEVRPVRIGGDRAGFIIAGGEEREEAIAFADKAEAHIHFEYC